MHEPENDITRRKHGGNEASTAAHSKVAKIVSRQAVIDALRKRNGESYSKQIARDLGKPLHAISGRISELKSDAIVKTLKGNRIEGCEWIALTEGI